jgi:phenylalanyl-tRNA synthetase beta chain
MKISVSWLREYVDVNVPLRELIDRLTMIGLVVEGFEEKGGDIVLDVETYANRPDTLGHLGVAREVAAMLGIPLKTQSWPLAEIETSTAELVGVEILDEDLCPRYCGIALKDVRIGPSPDWLQARLEAIGLRPINNVVDVTNYVLFATAQPIHAFDLAKLEGPRIIVRRAKKGEGLKTLDGKDAELGPEMLVIADAKKPVAIAGVIGGESSSVTESTRDVFIESACFDPVSVRKTRKALEVQTDASYRYERGADIAIAPQAALIAASLLTQFGGKATKGLIDIYPRPRKVRDVVLRSRRIADLLGVDVDDAFVEKTLGDLGFALKAQPGGFWHVQVPSFRVDIEREADLIEDIARFYGYNKIPVVVPPLEVVEPVISDRGSLDKLSQQLFHYGFDEVINLSFAEPEAEAVFQSGNSPIEIRNPISSRASLLRTTILSGLLEDTARNRNRGIERVYIFEIGNVYFWQDNAAVEGLRLGLLTTGPLAPPHWREKQAETNFFHLKGALEAVLDSLRYASYSCEERLHPFFEEGFGLAVLYKGETVGHLGCVGQPILDFYSVKGPVYAAELNLTLLLAKQPRAFEVAPLPRFPSVVRDLSFLVDLAVAYQDIRMAIEKMAVPNLEEFCVVDHYAGDNIPKDKKSLSFRFVYRNAKATLTTEDVDKAEQKILKNLKAAFKIHLREGGSS